MLLTLKLRREHIEKLDGVNYTQAGTVMQEIREFRKKGKEYNPTLQDYADYRGVTIQLVLYLLTATIEIIREDFLEVQIKQWKTIKLEGKYAGQYYIEYNDDDTYDIGIRGEEDENGKKSDKDDSEDKNDPKDKRISN